MILIIMFLKQINQQTTIDYIVFCMVILYTSRKQIRNNLRTTLTSKSLYRSRSISYARFNILAFINNAQPATRIL